ncbi:MAG: hypothetical protein L3K13_03630 [Thermoplasmata archaeon]|nr:hypothetical protein [Thermoplasmata archaeon]
MNAEWLKAQGLGRERFAAHVQSYLVEIGYRCDVVDREGATEVLARIGRMNPAIPPGLAALRFRLVPTSGGSALFWEAPTEIDAAQRAPADRVAKELEQYLLRVALTESHGTAKVRTAPGARPPWHPAPTSTGAADDGAPAPL